MWILPAEVMALFRERQNPIHQLELLPVLIATLIWKERIRGRALLAFLDNEGAKAALVSGYSTNETSAAIVNRIGDEFAALSARTWFERVPSPSNPSDAPSRGHAPPAFERWNTPVQTLVTPEVKALSKCLLAVEDFRAAHR